MLLAVDGDLATGSGRSIPGIHLHDFLADWRDQLPKFGGHAQAVGLSVESERLEQLRSALEEAAAAWSELISVRHLEYELELSATELNSALMSELQRFEPHGQANPRPLIRVRGPLRLAGTPRRFGKGNLEAEATDADGGRLRMVGWGWQEREDSLAGEFEALGHLLFDRYRQAPVLRLVDSRPAALTDSSES